MWEVPEVNQIRTQNQAKQDEAKESEARSLFSVRLFTTPWTIAHQAPPSMGFSRQEHWSGLPFPSPGDLSNPGLNLCLLHCRQTLYHLKHQRHPKGNPEAMPHKSDSNHHKGTTLPVTCPVCLCKYGTLFPSDKYLFIYFSSLWEFFSAKPKGQSLVTDHWSSC